MQSEKRRPNVPNAPDLAGLAFRCYRDEGDIAAMQFVHDGCREADATDRLSVCYRLPNLSPIEYSKEVAGSQADGSGCNVLIAEVDARIVAHSRLEWWNEWDSDRGQNAVRI